MAKLISLRIDVSKIDKSRLYKGEKGTYLDLTVSLNDETDDYGNNVAAWENQTKEERESKVNKNYLGNGKVFWSNDGNNSQSQQATQAANDLNQDDHDDLPF